MKKIVLNPEDLRVEAFHTSSSDKSRGGTVRAHDDETFYWPCQTGTCASCDLHCLPMPGTGRAE
jgi:hypothetical protein